MKSGSDSISDNFLDLHDYVTLHVNILVWIRFREICLKHLVAELVTWLILTIVLGILLNGVIYQVNIFVM